MKFSLFFQSTVSVYALQVYRMRLAIRLHVRATLQIFTYSHVSRAWAQALSVAGTAAVRARPRKRVLRRFFRRSAAPSARTAVYPCGRLSVGRRRNSVRSLSPAVAPWSSTVAMRLTRCRRSRFAEIFDQTTGCLCGPEPDRPSRFVAEPNRFLRKIFHYIAGMDHGRWRRSRSIIYVWLPVSDWLVLVFLRALKPNNGLPLSSVGPTP